MDWQIIFALVSLTLGFLTGIAGIRSMRSKSHPTAEVAWKQDPLSAWKYETPSILALAIHSLGLLCLAACLLFDLRRSEVLRFPIERVDLFTLALVGIFFTANLSGVVIAYHLARQWIRPVSYGICKDGMLYGGSLISWKSYNHYELGPEDGQISLYSSYSPSLRNWVIQPAPESYLGVLALIQKNLSPASPIADDMVWTHSPLVLILGMILLVLAGLLPAVWGLLQNQPWTWTYALVAFFLVNLLGNRWMTIYDGRGKYKEQKVQTL
ncbi:MAG TPA: hypothetical protein VHP14_13035 [Anaerolineales bacterium]|nr:hypothetical protein [Anaerolineales bacterium]